MKTNEKIYIGLLFVVIASVFYATGYTSGVNDSLNTILDHAPTILDIELTDRAKMVLLSNPRIIYQVLTIESLAKLYDDLNVSANAKGGIGPTWGVELK